VAGCGWAVGTVRTTDVHAAAGRRTAAAERGRRCPGRPDRPTAARGVHEPGVGRDGAELPGAGRGDRTVGAGRAGVSTAPGCARPAAMRVHRTVLALLVVGCSSGPADPADSDAE